MHTALGVYHSTLSERIVHGWMFNTVIHSVFFTRVVMKLFKCYFLQMFAFWCFFLFVNLFFSPGEKNRKTSGIGRHHTLVDQILFVECLFVCLSRNNKINIHFRKFLLSVHGISSWFTKKTFSACVNETDNGDKSCAKTKQGLGKFFGI